jgi:hypothetical protein
MTTKGLTKLGYLLCPNSTTFYTFLQLLDKNLRKEAIKMDKSPDAETETANANESRKFTAKVNEYDFRNQGWCITGVAKLKQAMIEQDLSYDQAIHVLQATSESLAEERNCVKMSVVKE